MSPVSRLGNWDSGKCCDWLRTTQWGGGGLPAWLFTGWLGSLHCPTRGSQVATVPSVSTRGQQMTVRIVVWRGGWSCGPAPAHHLCWFSARAGKPRAVRTEAPFLPRELPVGGRHRHSRGIVNRAPQRRGCGSHKHGAKPLDPVHLSQAILMGLGGAAQALGFRRCPPRCDVSGLWQDCLLLSQARRADSHSPRQGPT